MGSCPGGSKYDAVKYSLVKCAGARLRTPQNRNRLTERSVLRADDRTADALTLVAQADALAELLTAARKVVAAAFLAQLPAVLRIHLTNPEQSKCRHGHPAGEPADGLSS